MGEDADRTADPLRPILRLAWGFVAAVAFILVGFLVVSLFLSGTWTVSRTVVLHLEKQEAFRLIANLDAWDDWMHWPELSGEERSTRGAVGDRIRWDDPGLGDGVVTLTALEPDSLVGYGVEIEGGALEIDGSFRLHAVAGAQSGTRVTWTESGDFGWNPFLRWMALGLPRMQGVEMEKALVRLQELIPPPASAPPAEGASVSRPSGPGPGVPCCSPSGASRRGAPA